MQIIICIVESFTADKIINLTMYKHLYYALSLKYDIYSDLYPTTYKTIDASLHHGQHKYRGRHPVQIDELTLAAL